MFKKFFSYSFFFIFFKFKYEPNVFRYGTEYNTCNNSILFTFVIQDIAGKIRIDFQDKKSLRVLTETLLKHDFDLHINIPPDNLNPAITLRMNYVLWIEDLMKYFKLKMDKITGIDIGIYKNLFKVLLQT